MAQGFMYLVAIIDWYSRYVLAWQPSNTLDGRFCVATLDQALCTAQPAIFNTDQGVQFTAQTFTQRQAAAGIQISMDSRGRALDKADFPTFLFNDPQIRKKDSVTAHLPKGIEAHRRLKRAA